MDVAGVVIGSIALFLSIFASSVAVYQLQRLWRFRRPVIQIESAEFGIRNQEDGAKTYIFLTSGNMILNIRGASRPLPIASYMVRCLTRVRKATSVGFGAGSDIGRVSPAAGDISEVPYLAEIPPGSWKRFNLQVPMGAPLAEFAEGEDVKPPEFVNLELLFESPEELFAPIPFTLRQSGPEMYKNTDRGWFRMRLKRSWKSKLQNQARRLIAALRRRRMNGGG